MVTDHPDRPPRRQRKPDVRSAGTSTSDFGVGKREGHDSSAFYARFQTPTLDDDETVNSPTVIDQILVGDSRSMAQVADNSVALVVTSPPYFAGKAYEAELGQGHIPATYVEYLQQLRDVFAECVRVLEPGGRIAVNVANLGRRPYRSLANDVTSILQDDLRLLLRGEVVWLKQRGAGGNCAWGSFQRPGNPVMRDLSERVVIASKGRFDRAIDPKRRAKLGMPSTSTLSRDEFMEATVDLWEIPPESAARIGHPAPFPVALPERLIHMNTYLGDVVLDPFMGSGTTAVAAVRTGRHYVGFDTDPSYVAAAIERVQGQRYLEQVQLRAGDTRQTDPTVGGWATKDLARSLLMAAGFVGVDDRATVVAGVKPTLRAVSATGVVWWFEVVGGRTSSRPGAQRIELVWRAIAKGAVIRDSAPADRFAVLTTALPSVQSGGKALVAVTGPDRSVQAVIDLTSDDAAVQLQHLANQR